MGDRRMPVTDEKRGRLVMIREGVHDRLVEMKKKFEEKLGEEVSFDVFLLSVLEMLDKLEMQKEEMERVPPHRGVERIGFPKPIWVVNPTPLIPRVTEMDRLSWQSKTTDDTVSYHVNTTCDVCGSRLTGVVCEKCGWFVQE